MNQIRFTYNDLNTRVNTYADELSKISDRLEEVQSQMDDLGSDMTSPKPLVTIRQALQRLKVINYCLRICILTYVYF